MGRVRREGAGIASCTDWMESWRGAPPGAPPLLPLGEILSGVMVRGQHWDFRRSLISVFLACLNAGHSRGLGTKVMAQEQGAGDPALRLPTHNTLT